MIIYTNTLEHVGGVFRLPGRLHESYNFIESVRVETKRYGEVEVKNAGEVGGFRVGYSPW